ncbi:alpha-L-fucosidase [Catalinimonas sp. 4WD22]|uniref:alpha-L-fucosidase n=1 Tax=Catalinimonas locisalis TaxID=3133978 RepID=UPI00310199FD
MRKVLYQFIMIAVVILLFGKCQSNSGQESEQVENTPILSTTLTDEDILNESEEDFDKRMEWWRDAKFGMFIHWGPYAIPAGEYQGKEVEGVGEWIMNTAQIPVEEYEKFSAQFNPTEYDADKWVEIAKNAGMKYIVITSKHHDGFALWDSEVSEYDVMDFAPIQRDLLAELKAACEKHGVKLCFYHSIMDWHHPDAQAPHYPDYNTDEKENPNFQQYVDNYLFPQVTELVEKYDPYVMWFDGEWIPEWTHENGVRMYTHLRKLNPNLIINNRVDKGRQGMQGMNDSSEDYVGDFGTPEQEILEGTSEFDWEACMTMNDSWGYKKSDDNWKSKEMLIHNLVDVTAKGGNYLLNIGPTPEGTIPAPSVERLMAMGDWLDINGEAIYETERLQNDYQEGEDIRFTKKKGESTYYGITLKAPQGQLNFKSLKPEDGSEVYLLGYDQPLEWTHDETSGLTITVPSEAGSNVDFAWVFKISGQEIA